MADELSGHVSVTPVSSISKDLYRAISASVDILARGPVDSSMDAESSAQVSRNLSQGFVSSKITSQHHVDNQIRARFFISLDHGREILLPTTVGNSTLSTVPINNPSIDETIARMPTSVKEVVSDFAETMATDDLIDGETEEEMLSRFQDSLVDVLLLERIAANCKAFTTEPTNEDYDFNQLLIQALLEDGYLW